MKTVNGVEIECGVDAYSHDPMLSIEGPMGNVYFRPMKFEKARHVAGGHVHKHDHVTFLWRGSIRVRAWHVSSMTKSDAAGFETLVPPEESQMVIASYSAPARILIKKDWCHEITALEDKTFADCIYALRDFADQVTDQFNGDLEPYR